ncbi:MAG: hypothetical protein GXY05_13940 [Clostridiales bacterium]|nr:hypothetical protein [Clostridiales bacterium]
MDINRTHHPAAMLVEKTERSDLVSGNENMGQRIKDTADKVGVFGTIGAIIVGLIHCDKLGFVTGLLSASALTLATCAFVSLLYSYGDMIRITLEQGKILRKLEAEQNDAQPPPTSEPDMEPQPDSHETAAGQAESSEQPEPTAADIGLSGEEPPDEAEPVTEKETAPELPMEAHAYDKTQRIAHFARRTISGVICPVCGKLQTPDNDSCFRCSCRFYFDDESQDRNKHIA